MLGSGCRVEIRTAPESEISVLGAILIDPEAYGRVAGIVTPAMFYDHERRLCFTAAGELHAAGKVIDPPTLIDALPPDVDRHALVADWLDAVPTAANVEHHARTVREAYIARRPAEIYAQAAGTAASLTPGEIQSAVEKQFAELRLLGDADRPKRFLTADEMQQLPRPDYLVHGILPKKSFSIVFGPPEAGKSFLALDISLCIATGFRWLGREVLQGPVVYIAGEGAEGFGPRIAAWRQHRSCRMRPLIYFERNAVSLLQPGEAERLINDIRREIGEDPSLVVLDTLSRCVAGADENSQGEMSTFVANVDKIREATGAAVMALHHPNVSGERERGSTVLRGAADMMLSVKKDDDGTVTLKCEKNKDAPHFKNITLELIPVADSAVIGFTNGKKTAIGFTDNETKVLRSLSEGFTSLGGTNSEWRAHAKDAYKVSDSTFNRARKRCLELGYVEGDEGRKGARYTVTEAGQQCLVSHGVKTVSETESALVSSVSGGLQAPDRDTNATDDDYERWEAERSLGLVDDAA
jgi:hypothetical protein